MWHSGYDIERYVYDILQPAKVMPHQSSSLSHAHHPFKSHETNLEHTSEVETHETHCEGSKEMVIEKLCRPLIQLSSKYDKDQ